MNPHLVIITGSIPSRSIDIKLRISCSKSAVKLSRAQDHFAARRLTSPERGSL